MPYYSEVKDALATSSPYHFTFYTRAITDNILLVDILAGNSSAGCHVTIYKLLIARDMLGIVPFDKRTFMLCL